jgi:hypothetical protein
MFRFTLDEASMPFNYFEEVGFSFDEIAVQAIQNKFTTLSESECQKIYEDNYDLFSEMCIELIYSKAITDYCIGEEDVDESSGTWGFLHFEIDSLERANELLKRDTEMLFEKIKLNVSNN